jgi:hypothetical protein
MFNWKVREEGYENINNIDKLIKVLSKITSWLSLSPLL